MDTLDLFDNTNGEEGEELEEELTAAEVLQKMEDAWINEKMAPELLDPKIEIVECMLEQVKTMEDNLTKIPKGDLRSPVHRMELQRIKFMVSGYLRLRLQKIQSNIFYYTRADENNPSRLTREETDFAAEFKEDTDQHFQTLALRHIPGAWNSEQASPSLQSPQQDSAVFISVRENCQGVEVRDNSEHGRDELLDLERGAQHLLKFSAISYLIEDGSVQLI